MLAPKHVSIRPSNLSFATRLAVGLGTGLLLLQSGMAAEKFGKAPASLDYPTAKAEQEFDATADASLNNVSEFFFLSERNPFERVPVEAKNPLTGKKVDKVLTGPAFKARRSGGGFDYYRYVTFYDVEKHRERIYDLPIQRQECHDGADYFAAYEYQYKVRTSVTAGIEIEGLGLNTSIETEKSYNMRRQLRATAGLVAEHTPYFTKSDWYGQTFIQTYDSVTNRYDIIKKQQRATSIWFNLLFPLLARSEYPMDFAVKNADWTFEVEREIIRRCSPEETVPARGAGNSPGSPAF